MAWRSPLAFLATMFILEAEALGQQEQEKKCQCTLSVLVLNDPGAGEQLKFEVSASKKGGDDCTCTITIEVIRLNEELTEAKRQTVLNTELTDDIKGQEFATSTSSEGSDACDVYVVCAHVVCKKGDVVEDACCDTAVGHVAVPAAEFDNRLDLKLELTKGEKAGEAVEVNVKVEEKLPTEETETKACTINVKATRIDDDECKIAANTTETLLDSGFKGVLKQKLKTVKAHVNSGICDVIVVRAEAKCIIKTREDGEKVFRACDAKSVEVTKEK